MSDQTSILDMAKQSRFFDQRLLADDVLATAENGPKSLAIQPSTVPGFAHVSVIDFETSSTECTGKPIRRDAIALFLDGVLPGSIDEIEWRITATAKRWQRGLMEIGSAVNSCLRNRDAIPEQRPAKPLPGQLSLFD